MRCGRWLTSDTNCSMLSSNEMSWWLVAVSFLFVWDVRFIDLLLFLSGVLKTSFEISNDKNIMHPILMLLLHGLSLVFLVHFFCLTHSLNCHSVADPDHTGQHYLTTLFRLFGSPARTQWEENERTETHLGQAFGPGCWKKNRPARRES